MHCTRASRLPPGNLRKPLEFLVFLYALQKGRPDAFHQNLTLSQKSFKNLVKMNNSAMWPSASPSPARSGPRRPSRIPRGPPSETIGIPCVSEVPPLEFRWRPRSPGWCTDTYHPILTLIQNPFKNLVKMNNSTVWSLPTAAQRTSGPRHARAERELRAKCSTWESLKNHRKTLCSQCAPQVHRCCHHSVLRSWDHLGVRVGCMVSTWELNAKLIKSHVMWDT